MKKGDKEGTVFLCFSGDIILCHRDTETQNFSGLTEASPANFNRYAA